MNKLFYGIKLFFSRKEKNKPPVVFENFTNEQYKILLSKLKPEKRMLLEFETVENERYGIKNYDDDIYIISEIKINIFFNSVFIRYKIMQGDDIYKECLYCNFTKNPTGMKIDNNFDAFKYFIENINTEKCKIEIYTKKLFRTNFDKIKESLYNFLKDEHHKKTKT